MEIPIGIRFDDGKNSEEEFSCTKTITILELSDAGFTTMLPGIGDLLELEEIDLSGNELEELPDVFEGMQKLKTLRLGRNFLKDLPKSLESCRALQHVELQDNEFTAIPTALLKTGLKHLDLGGNRLKVDETPEFPAGLQFLSLSNCGVKRLGRSLSKLHNLIDVNLEGNQLRELEDFHPNSKIERLSLNDNGGLSNLPISVRALTRIRNGSFVDTGIKEVPDWLRELADLETLDLSGNYIEEIPKALQDLTKLRLLDLTKNKITSVPPFLAQLPSLETLRLSKNEISYLPYEMVGFAAELEILDNPLVDPSTEFPPPVEDNKSLLFASFRALHKNGQKCSPGELPATCLSTLEGTRSCTTANCQGLYVPGFGRRFRPVQFNLWEETMLKTEKVTCHPDCEDDNPKNVGK